MAAAGLLHLLLALGLVLQLEALIIQVPQYEAAVLPVEDQPWHIDLNTLENHPAGNSVDEFVDWQQQDPLLVLASYENKDDEHSKPTDVMIAEAGYPSEVHTVITDDGYILHMHRIPHGRGESYNTSRKVVFLQHGLLSSSADWVVTGPGNALAFLLADRGYDVWLGNYRGNTYSLGHKNPDITKQQYWSFSWDEMAKYDLPAMLQHLMAVTGQDRFHYIGHSMGTLSYYTACNYHDWIANATKLMVGYGPHTIVPNLVSPIFKLLTNYMDDLQFILEHLGIYDFMPSNWLIQWLASEVCDDAMATQAICRNIMFLIAGYNKNEMNSTILPYILGHTPAGTSTVNMLHYGQSVVHGTWLGMDFGTDAANVEHWNSTKPPVYFYEPVTAPCALYWAQSDWLVVPEDAAYLKDHLPNVVKFERVGEDEYNHLDFVWAINNPTLLYNPTMDFMEQYN